MGQRVDKVDMATFIEQAEQLRPQGVKVAGLNLDQQLAANDVDDEAAEFDLELIALPRQVILEPGVERTFGQ